jgi:hypothetical protein
LEIAMDRVLPFPAERVRRTPPEDGGRTTGVVLLFTGVRYERHDAAQPSPVREGGRRKRPR